ncbi:MAG: hypothetical protein QW791_09305 [Candidatus Bathyarchaeia archaeon]
MTFSNGKSRGGGARENKAGWSAIFILTDLSKLLGHKRIQNTLIYTQLIEFQGDEYVCRVASTIEEAKQLIEAGFEYICDIEGVKLFRKRK